MKRRGGMNVKAIYESSKSDERATYGRARMTVFTGMKGVAGKKRRTAFDAPAPGKHQRCSQSHGAYVTGIVWVQV